MYYSVGNILLRVLVDLKQMKFKAEDQNALESQSQNSPGLNGGGRYWVGYCRHRFHTPPKQQEAAVHCSAQQKALKLHVILLAVPHAAWLKLTLSEVSPPSLTVTAHSPHSVQCSLSDHDLPLTLQVAFQTYQPQNVIFVLIFHPALLHAGEFFPQ